MLGTGLILYMLSKEIYVINHETFAAASIGAVIIYGVKKFGPKVAAIADKINEVRWQPYRFLLLAVHLVSISMLGEIILNNYQYAVQAFSQKSLVFCAQPL